MNCSFVGMNYLAHAYLSFDSPPIVVGNMISDFVKGAAKLGFSGKVQKGITLHRHIDEFTDNHFATKKAKEFFRPAYRLYSGAIVDVLYDHFLANDHSIFSESSLKKFSAGIYQHLEAYTAELPPRFLYVFTYMRTEDWLFNYRTTEGMRKSLAGLVRRAAYLSESTTAYNLFIEHYVSLNECYQEFFADVKLFAKQKLQELATEF
jgi:acyl carrier protein phosphodiesterase